MEVWGVLVDRLRAFLVLNWDTNPHIGSTDRVASRMELLDALGQVGVLGIAGEDCGLVEVLTAILNTMDLDANLNPRFLHVSVCTDSHGLSRPDLAVRAAIVRILRVHCHCLVDVGLHKLLVLRIRRVAHHALVTTLSRVSDTLNGLTLAGSARNSRRLSRQGWLSTTERSVCV